MHNSNTTKSDTNKDSNFSLNNKTRIVLLAYHVLNVPAGIEGPQHVPPLFVYAFMLLFLNNEGATFPLHFISYVISPAVNREVNARLSKAPSI